MAYKVQNARILTPEELVTILRKSAKLYSEYADTTLLFIFREKKADAYDFYESRFGKNNFMHLAGIKSEMLSANAFYEACLNGAIIREHCNPRRDANTMYSKVAIMEQMLDLRNSKCYKIGEKNLVTRDNDFEMATGNANGVIGYDSRVKKKGTDEVDRKKAPIPTTLLNNPITDYCSRPQKIMFILQKSDNESTYKDLFYEIKKGLFETERACFSDELKTLISI
jgi:hypothetical protein